MNGTSAAGEFRWEVSETASLLTVQSLVFETSFGCWTVFY